MKYEQHLAYQEQMLYTYAALCEKYHCLPYHLGKLTDTQIESILCHKRDKHGVLIFPGSSGGTGSARDDDRPRRSSGSGITYVKNADGSTGIETDGESLGTLEQEKLKVYSLIMKLVEPDKQQQAIADAYKRLDERYPIIAAQKTQEKAAQEKDKKSKRET